MGLGAVVGAAGSILGGLSSRNAAKDATNAQTAIGNRQMDLQQRVYDDQTQRFSPFLGSGTNALRAYDFEMGLGDRPTFGGSTPAVESYFTGGSGGGSGASEPFVNTAMNSLMRQMMGMKAPKAATRSRGTERFRVNGQSFATREEADAFARANATGGTEYGGYRMSPGARWQMEQGQAAIDASAALRGGSFSGRTIQDTLNFSQGLADQDRETYLSRLAGMTDMGMGAAGMQATAGNNFAAGTGNALANIGNAQSAGAIGQGNALAGMFNNLGQTFGYMNKPKTLGVM